MPPASGTSSPGPTEMRERDTGAPGPAGPRRQGWGGAHPPAAPAPWEGPKVGVSGRTHPLTRLWMREGAHITRVCWWKGENIAPSTPKAPGRVYHLPARTDTRACKCWEAGLRLRTSASPVPPDGFCSHLASTREGLTVSPRRGVFIRKFKNFPKPTMKVGHLPL